MTSSPRRPRAGAGAPGGRASPAAGARWTLRLALLGLGLLGLAAAAAAQDSEDCLLCHEDPELAPPNRHVLALRRQPVAIGVVDEGAAEGGDR